MLIPEISMTIYRILTHKKRILPTLVLTLSLAIHPTSLFASDYSAFEGTSHNARVIVDPSDPNGVIIMTRINSADNFAKVRAEGLKSFYEINKANRQQVLNKHDLCIYFRPPGFISEGEKNVIGIKVDPKLIRVANQEVRDVKYDNPFTAYQASSIPLDEYICLKEKNAKLSPPLFPFSLTHSGYLLWCTAAEEYRRPDLSVWIPEIVIEVSCISPKMFAYVSE